MKRCSMCGKLKPLEEFYRHCRSRDGRQSACASCSAIAARERYKNPAIRKKIQERQRDYYNSGGRTVLRRRAQKPGFQEDENTKRRARRNKDPEAYNKKRREWYKKNKDKVIAHAAVYYAVSTGKLTKPKTCSINDEFCSGRIEAHHDDYSKKLDVIWFCRWHHQELHRIRDGYGWVSNSEKHEDEL